MNIAILIPYDMLDSVQSANPIEKIILYRLLSLLRLNIEFIFVFDGPRRPRGKRGKHGGGGVQWKEIALLKNLLKQLGVAQHIAPGEAEAECAALQRHGVVDAVWSDDCDCLMFGCSTLIRDFREAGKKSRTKVRVYHAEVIRETLGLDREGLVAFAVLNGGDYDTTGLRGCGPKLALRAAKTGIGKSLCAAMEYGLGLSAWKSELADFLRLQRKPLEIPPAYPSAEKVRLYYKPLVSGDYQLAHLNGLRNGWNREIDEAKLREHLREYFNFSTKEYVKHITPVLLARSMLYASLERRALIGNTDMQAAKRSKKEIEEFTASTKKISFKATEITCVDLRESVAKDLEMERQKKGPPFDPESRVECEFLDVVLKHAFPHRDFTTAPTRKRKSIKSRQNREANSDDSPPERPRKRKSWEANAVDDCDQCPKADTGNKRQRKEPRKLTDNCHSQETTQATADVAVIDLQICDLDGALEERLSSPDLPDLDSASRTPRALAPLSLNASPRRLKDVKLPGLTTESRATVAAFGHLIRKDVKTSVVDFIDLTND